MCTPTPQQYGASSLYDDREIGDADLLLKHCRTPAQLVPDEMAAGGLRLSSASWKDKAHASVDVDCLLKKDGLPSDHRLGSMPNTYGMISITAGVARQHAGGIAYTPKPEEPAEIGAARAANPYHGDVIGPIKGSAARKLLDASEVVVPFQMVAFPDPNAAVMS